MQIPASRRLKGLIVALTAVGATWLGSAAAAQAMPFIDGLHTISTVSPAVPASGPAMGDQNPYGVAVVRKSVGDLVRGDVLVSNFNNSMNQQGTGSSIVEISPAGAQHVFAVVPKPTSTPAVGLTTALVELQRGFVVVGNLPAPGGDSTKMTAGALTVLGPTGHVVTTIKASDINGPWDMNAVDHGSSATLFVTNVLNGTVAAKGKVVKRGTVVRLKLTLPKSGMPSVVSNQVIASGFAEHTDPSALVVGPTGVGLGAHGTLYVADSNGSRIAAIPNALTRTTVMGHGGMTLSAGGALNDPLGLMIAPNHDVVTANGGDGKIVETSPSGHQVAKKTLVPNGAGDLFGLALAPGNHGIYFVDDAGSGSASNSLRLVR
jgi:hypothetical protein